MAENDRITLVIEGLPEDDGEVRLGAFIAQLQGLIATIGKLDREANNGKPASYYTIAELSYNSPARVVIDPQPLPKQPYVGPIVIESLNRIANAIQSGADLTGIDADLLEDIRGLANPVGKTVKTATLLFDGHRLDLTEKVGLQLETALAVDEEFSGSIEGMLEQINIHHGANTFHIYPSVGPKKVTCHFPPKLYDDAVSAVGRRVEVSGSLRYRANAKFPHQVGVTSIEAFPVEDDLPMWDDIRGRAPDATGGLSSEDFVRELRDAWR